MKGFGFWNESLVGSIMDAQRYAGATGRIATMPDLAGARAIAKPRHSKIWSQWYTSNTGEYFGLNHEGKPTIVVAHGVGPLADTERLEQIFYGEDFDHEVLKRHQVGRISNEDFLALLDGKFGDVSIVDPLEVMEIYGDSSTIDYKTCSKDPLTKARLGSSHEQFLSALLKYSHAVIQEHGNTMNDFIIKSVVDVYKTRYSWDKDKKVEERLKKEQLEVLSQGAVAQFITMGAPMYTSGDGRSSIIVELDIQGDHYSSKHVGMANVQKEDVLDEVHVVDVKFERDIEKIITSVSQKNELSLPEPYCLMRLKDNFYAMYPKEGARMDTHSPKFLVTDVVSIESDQKFFRTPGYGSPFFKYDLSEIRDILPEGANAYLIGDPELDRGDHVVTISFFNVALDTSKRVMLKDEIFKNTELLMSLQS